MQNVEFNQKLVDQFFKNWVGISTYNTEDSQKGPSVFGLYFPSRKIAVRSYVFLIEWQKWKDDQDMILSVVEESDEKFSFYIYKENRKEFVKGTFSENLNIPELRKFLKNETGRKFVIIARFPDSNNNIVDNPSQNIMLIERLKFAERTNIKSTQIENN